MAITDDDCSLNSATEHSKTKTPSTSHGTTSLCESSLTQLDYSASSLTHPLEEQEMEHKNNTGEEEDDDFDLTFRSYNTASSLPPLDHDKTWKTLDSVHSSKAGSTMHSFLDFSHSSSSSMNDSFCSFGGGSESSLDDSCLHEQRKAFTRQDSGGDACAQSKGLAALHHQQHHSPVRTTALPHGPGLVGMMRGLSVRNNNRRGSWHGCSLDLIEESKELALE